MSTTPSLPLWVQDREEVLKQDDGVEWRDGNRLSYCIDSDVTGFDITACNLLKNMHRLVLMTTNLVNV